MQREILEGKQFDDIFVEEYIGNKRYRTRCTICGDIKYMLGSNIKKRSGTKCHLAGEPINLEGLQIGEWSVIKYIGNKKYWCKCSCGNEKPVLKANLLNGSSTSCGHNRNNYGNLVGQTFNEWKVIGKEGYLYRCECSCGTQRLISSGDLVSGKTKSCGHDYNHFDDLSGKQFGNWRVIRYIGNQYYECECQCENHTISSVRRADLIRGKSTSCGCMKHLKAKETILTRYGEVGPNKIYNGRSAKQINAIQSKDNLKAFIDDMIEKPNSLELANELGLGLNRTLVLLHKYELYDYINKDVGRSNNENELYNYISSIYRGQIYRNNRSILGGKELDIYLPELKLAFEFNGSYWHSSACVNKNYHFEKSSLCGRKGIRLIHIFEYEWTNPLKRLKLEQYIKYLIVKSDNVIYARDTVVCEIDSSEAYSFEEKYHLQGKAVSRINLAISYNEDIVGIMTFSKPRFNSAYEYELIRLCYKADTTVIGGTAKLFKYFINKYNPNSIISYCDIAKFIGDSYDKIGFKLAKNKITEPSYVWLDTDTGNVLTRFDTQKHKLIDNGLGDEHQTEDEIMIGLGFLKIYDCGNLKYEWIKDNKCNDKQEVNV